VRLKDNGSQNRYEGSANQNHQSTEEPLRYHRTFGLDAEQLDELEELIGELLAEPWDKGAFEVNREAVAV
jgi:hypothetical protein